MLNRTPSTNPRIKAKYQLPVSKPKASMPVSVLCSADLSGVTRTPRSQWHRHNCVLQSGYAWASLRFFLFKNLILPNIYYSTLISLNLPSACPFPSKTQWDLSKAGSLEIPLGKLPIFMQWASDPVTMFAPVSGFHTLPQLYRLLHRGLAHCLSSFLFLDTLVPLP